KHLRCLRRAAQHEMDVGGEAQRMFFDASSFLLAPGCGGGSNTIGEEAVDDAGQEISHILSIAGGGNDLVPMRLVCNEGVDAVIGIDESGNDPEAKLLLRESIEHLFDCAERNICCWRPWAGSGHPSRFDTVLRNTHIGCAPRLPSRQPRYPPSLRPVPRGGLPKRFPKKQFPRS